MEQDGRIGQGIISLEHVTKRFESAGRVKEVVDDVSLEVKENEFVVLFGPGQCGKTTMINLIAGLELVTEGTVYALSVMFVKEPIKIMAYLGSSPTPNHRMTSGIQAMGGMGRINSNKGLMIASA